jgi:hypothetical protein
VSYEYRGLHTAPSAEPGSSLDDPTSAFGGDEIYGPNGLRYYGSGGPAPTQDAVTQAWARRMLRADLETLAAIRAARGRPDALVTVYRAVPVEAAGEIAPGDWVTPSRTYAEIHGESNLEGPDGGYDDPSEFKILTARVRAGDLYTAGDLNEWGYDPQGGA